MRSKLFISSLEAGSWGEAVRAGKLPDLRITGKEQKNSCFLRRILVKRLCHETKGKFIEL